MLLCNDQNGYQKVHLISEETSDQWMLEKECLIIEGEKECPDAVQEQDPSKVPQVREKRRDIQGLRGLAIIYVLIFHLSPTLLPRGFLGVDIFFIISGYLITMILWKNESMTMNSVKNFYSKRIRRIFPAHFTMVLLVLIAGYVWLANEDYRLLRINSGWAISFTFNIHKYLQNLDYFAEISNYGFMLHTWSLAVEIQYYLFAPIIVFVCRKGLLGQAIWVLLFGTSVVFSFVTTGPLHFSSLPSRIWQFLLGGTAYLFPLDFGKPIFASVGLACVSPLILLVPMPEKLCRPIVVIAAATLIAANERITDKYILGNAVLYFIGDVSYSLYLAHWPTILFLRYYSNITSLGWEDAIAAAEISVLLSIISFYTIERYFIKNGFLHTLIYLILVTAGCLVLILHDFKSGGTQAVLNITSVTGNYTLSTKTRFESFCYDFRDVPHVPSYNISASARQQAIKKNKYFLANHFFSFSDTYGFNDKPYEKYFIQTKTKINYHDYLEGDGTVTLVVFGNSYAHRAFRYVVSAFGDRLKEARLLAISRCIPFPYSPPPNCRGFFDKSIELMEETKPDFVFIIFRPYDQFVAEIIDITTDQAMKDMQATIDRLAKVSKRIVLQFPLPLLSDKTQTPLLLKCLEKKLPLEDMCIDYKKNWQGFQYIFRRMEYIQCDKCIKIYPHKIFCDSMVCRVFDPDNLWSFFDANHHYNEYAMKCIGKLYNDTVNDMIVKGLLD